MHTALKLQHGAKIDIFIQRVPYLRFHCIPTNNASTYPCSLCNEWADSRLANDGGQSSSGGPESLVHVQRAHVS